MDSQNTSVRPHAPSRRARKNHPSGGGVVHDNTRHSSRFTVVGNHLAQHAELSLVAIGLATHIQSLPTGAAVDIKSLAARFPEGTTKIASALRELEAHGYLRRTRERTASGRMITRTVSCNQPGRSSNDTRGEPPPKPRPRQHQPKEPRRRALPAVPQPAWPRLDLLQTAHAVLGCLRLEDRRLLLSAADTEHLVPGVVSWLERDVSSEAVHHALIADLPREPLHRPAALLAHRLADRLPPAPPFHAPAAPPPVRHPLQNCDDCDRAFRAAEPGGPCHDCRTGSFVLSPPPRP
ncbi:helix-turn-helix domain-containing protein [Streptomyces sp. NPDC101160]|uniref:helix-turn-helix domain-containing protein n=1 Tax=Streptomyces sp. NPDC101160 TaxID=3366118 RepID=UPI0037F1F649